MGTRSAQRSLKSWQGFTLIEVVIALGILAVSLAGVLLVARETTSNTLYLQQRTEANWMANNVLTMVQLQANSDGGLSPGRLQGVDEMGSGEWNWVVDVSQGRDPGVLHVVVNVAPGRQGREFVGHVESYVSMY